MRLALAAVLSSLIMTALGSPATAAILAPTGSSLTTSANVNASSATDSQSLGAVAPSPLAAGVNLTDGGLTGFAAGATAFASPDAGTIRFGDIGYTSNGNPGSYSASPTNFTYDFTATVDATLTLDFDVTFSDTTGLNGFGLQGFYIDLNGDFRTAGNNGANAINEIGTHVFNLLAGTAYTFTIYSNANISGGLPAGTASNSGLFTFTVTPAAIPAPPAAVLALVGAVTAVGGRRLRRAGA